MSKSAKVRLLLEQVLAQDEFEDFWRNLYDIRPQQLQDSFGYDPDKPPPKIQVTERPSVNHAPRTQSAPQIRYDKGLIGEWRYQAADGIASVDVSADGRRVVVGILSKEAVCLDANGRMLWQQTVGNQAWRIGISEDGERVCVGTGSTRPWDLAKRGVYYFDGEGRLLWSKDNKSSSWGFALSGDGQTVAVGTQNGRLLLYDGAGQLLWQDQIKGFGLNRVIVSTALAFNGSVVASGAFDYSLRVCDRSGRMITSLKGQDNMFAVSVSADGSTIAAGDSAGNLYILDQHGQLLWQTKMQDKTRDVKLSADGQKIAIGTAGKDEHIYLFNRQGVLLWKRFMTGSITSIALSRDTQDLVVGSRSGEIRIFDHVGELRHTAQTQGEIVRDVAISAAGDLVVAVSEDKQAYGFHFPV